LSQTARSQRGIIAVVAAAAVLLAIAGIVGALFLLPTRTVDVNGQVLDVASGSPLAGATLKVNGMELSTGPDGVFSIEGLQLGTSILAEALGYHSATARVGNDGRLQLSLSPRVLEGVVTDARAGRPLAGVNVSAGGLSAVTDAEGKYRLVGIAPGTEISLAAAGFLPATQQYQDQTNTSAALEPVSLTVRAVNQYTGAPLAGAQVTDGRDTSQTDQQGQAVLQYMRDGDEISVRLEGFTPAKLTYSGQETLEATLRPDTLTGIVQNENGEPVANATITMEGTTVTTDGQGRFQLSGVPEKVRITAAAEGYQRTTVEVERQTSAEVKLEKPFAAKSLYLTFYGIGDEGLRGHVVELAETTEVNAIVIDIKGDRGWISYRSSVPMVAEIGAQQDITIPNPRELLADLRSKGIYTIARIVTFKDNPLAMARPDLAIMNKYTGRPWIDMEDLAWTDPNKEEVWDYNIALAVEAIELGFDEVQFDYIRFPTDAGAGNPLDAIQFASENTMAARTKAINGFLKKASEAIHAAGGKVSIDIFGYVVWREDDMGIGQQLEDMAQYVDYVSPMIYPNLFWHGIPTPEGAKYGDQQSGHYPYEIVYESMKIAVDRIGPEKLRPWLQYYNDYITGKRYGAEEVRLQKQATYDAGVAGWLFWDPTNAFSKGGFEPR
jgi:hypothetical protein